MTLRAKGSMFWPNINKDIAKHVHSCVPCQTFSNLQQKEPAIPIEVPHRLWKLLGMDIFVQGNKYYLLVADYYSQFPYVQKMSSISSKKVIFGLSFCFSVLGKEYKEFADKWGFTMTTSSPHYPRGHGFIERQVQIIMRLFNRCDEYSVLEHN